MLLRHNKIINLSLIFLDILILNVVFLGVGYFTSFLWWQQNGNNFYSLIFQFNISWVFLVYSMKYYEVDFYFEPISRKTIRVVSNYLLITALIFFSIKKLSNAYGFFMFFIIGFFLSILFLRYSFLLLRKKYVFLKSDRRKVVLIGSGIMTNEIISILQRPDSGYEFIGRFSDDQDDSTSHKLGSVQSAIQYAIDHNIVDVFSLVLPYQNIHIKELIRIAEINSIRLRFIPDLKSFFNREIRINVEKNIPIIAFRKEPLEQLSNQVRKRIFDVVFSSLVFIFLLWWLIPIVAIIIKLDSKGPIFFIQVRSGKNGKEFKCYKFRSMFLNNDAESKSTAVDDERITRIGKYLRKTSIDEIPQFLNVLKGDMSVVGPRPHMVKQTEEYSKNVDAYKVRLYLKPGITGLAQVSGLRGELSHERMIQRLVLDIRYLEEWGFWHDVRIILRTILLMLQGDKNAY